MELEMKWMDQISEEIKSNGRSIVYEKEQWKKHCIYKIPSRVTEVNKMAYIPKAISFGPYHNGKEHLMPMEEHKHRALVHFLKRCKQPIELLFKRMDQVVQELRDSYKPLDPNWILDTPKFLKMMILDGCFILEILRADLNDYDENDPVFGKHGRVYMIPCINRDMLMLENQLPMIVLHTLNEVEIGTHHEEHHDESLNKKIIKLLNPCTPVIPSMGKCMHILDVYRKSLIQQGPTHPTRKPKATKRNWLCLEAREPIIRSATELNEAGIHFKKSKTPWSLRDVSFNQGVLRLPNLVVDDAIEYMLLNLITFESLHVGAGGEVISFVLFMDNIIDNAMDVALLNRSGIIFNGLGSDEAVAKLFNSLSKEITTAPDEVLDVVTTSMIDYCKKPWKRWRANLIQTYFRNPWAIVSLVAAIFLFALTIVQTVYTIRQFYQNPSPTK